MEYLFVEQSKVGSNIFTLGVFIDSEKLAELKINKVMLNEGLKILRGKKKWEDATSRLKNYLSLFIVELSPGPIVKKINTTSHSIVIQHQLDARQQTLRDFEIDELVSNYTAEREIFIRNNYYKLYSAIKTDSSLEKELEDLAYILTNFLIWSYSINDTQKLIEAAFREKLDEFQKFITKFPSLGAYHSMGQKIISAIQEIQPKNLKSSTYFRAREVNQSKIFQHEDMEAPSSEFVTREGRYNHIGMPILYLASDKETCIAEIMNPHESKLLWFQEFNLKEIKILDLTTIPGDSTAAKHNLLFAALIYKGEGVINQDSVREKVWKPEYYIPRFVADTAKMVGKYDGIKFSSNRGLGDNLALFEWEGKYSLESMPEIEFSTRKMILDYNTPPWKKDLKSMSCVHCGNKINESIRSCDRCGKVNPYYFLDDDI